MRRFEFVEDKSSKFWEIELSGVDFTVTWGRIGTTGQTQTKTFDTAEKATVEYDKLVKEKLKKGYVEAGNPTAAPSGRPPTVTAAPVTNPAATVERAAEAAPAPAPAAPSPVAASPVASRRAVEGGLCLTDAARRQMAPRHGKDLVSPRPVDATAAYTELRKQFESLAPAMSKCATTPGVDHATMNKVRSAFFAPDPPAELDLATQAAAFALGAPQSTYRDRTREAEFICYWVGAAGMEFALEAFARAWRVQIRATLDASYNLGTLALAPPTGALQYGYWREHRGPAWRPLRNALLRESETERVRLEAVAARLFAEAMAPSGEDDLTKRTTKRHLAATLAMTFENRLWATEVRALCGDGEREFWELLLIATDSVDVLTQQFRAQTSWTEIPVLMPIAYDLVAVLGPAIAPLFMELVHDLGRAGANAEFVRSFAEPLALVVTVDVARFFVDHLGARHLRVVASEYLTRYPEMTLGLVAQFASGKGAGPELGKALLRRMVTGAPELAREAAVASTPSVRALVEGILADGAAREDATPEALPPVLAAPPWTSKRKRAEAPIVIAGLTVEPYEEKMAWRPGEREQRLADRNWTPPDPVMRAKHLSAIAIANAADLTQIQSWNWPPAFPFTQLPDVDAIAAFNSARLENFVWAYSGVLEALIARHGVQIIPGLLRFARLNLGAAVDIAARMDAARIAPFMAEAFVRLKKARAAAATWLSTFPEAAVAGLLPAAVGETGAARTQAESALRFLSDRGHRALIEAAAARRGAEVAAAAASVLDFDPLQQIPKRVPSLPTFFSAAALSRPLLAGREKALPLAAVDAIGTMLAFTSFESPYVGLLQVREACDPRSLGEFVWDLFQSWLVSGAPSKEGWAMQALGLLGDDACARKLTPLIRAWPGEGAHARAVTGLEVLARIGTDVALMHLHGMAQKLKFKPLQEKARDKISQIAEARGLSAEELADRLVPDLGLDDDGTLRLDFGPRTFKVTFDESLKPSVVDESGKRQPDLPKPKQTDDSEKASAATETWKALKKDARTIAQGQILRLELAMCGRRRWADDVFNTFLVGHPLLVHLARRLVWGVYAPPSATGVAGELLHTFRVSEDGTFASATDDTFLLPAEASVGIVHPLEAETAVQTGALAATWGQILADYEILQPFEQIARAVYLPTDEERGGTQMSRVLGLKVPTGKVLGLDARGWNRGSAEDGGVVCHYEKPLPGGLVATLDLTEGGIFTGALSESPEQKLGFVTVGTEPGNWSKETQVAFGALPAVAFSELVRDLESLRR